MNDNERSIQLLKALAARLGDDSRFMAHALDAYQRHAHLDDAEMARELGAAPEMLLRLALCRRPASDAPDFAEQVRELADYTLIDETRLIAVIREVDSLAGFALPPAGLWVRLFAGARGQITAFRRQPAQLFAGAVCILLLVVTGALLWRAYRESPAPDIAQHRPQPTATLSEPAAQGSPAPGSTVTQQHSGETMAPTSPPAPVVIRRVNLEGRAALRDAAAAGGAKESAIRLPHARTRLLLKLPENSANGWYHASIVDEYDTPLARAQAKSLDGKRLNVMFDLRKLAARSYRLRLAQANGAPDYYAVRIASRQRGPQRKP
ncbi:MAG: hypothetical protein ACREEM_30325 [Blastocatellia bacterium]